MENITSTSNEKIKFYAKLNQKKFRDETGLFLLENFKLIQEAINRHEKIETIIIRTDAEKKYQNIINQFDNIILVSQPVFNKISDTVTSQGIIAVIKKPQEKTLNDIQGKTLVLDRIQDAGNVGTLMRSCLGFEFNNVVLIDCASPFSPKVIRSCGGSIFSLNLVETSESELISHIKSNNFAVFSADMQGENLYKIKNIPSNIMVIVGNEGQGVSDNLSKASTHIVSIPMSKKLESLNAGVSGSIIMSYLSTL